LRIKLKILLTGFAAYLVTCAVNAQEMSAARYLGALEGAVESCVQAYPQHAAMYRDTVRRSVQCELNDKAFAEWLAKMRTQPPHSLQYSQGHAEGRASLSKDAREAAKQCASLESLVCSGKVGFSPSTA
jgi:hypothetical protein